MTLQETGPKTAVVGAGAVGGYFGGLLARAGAPVVMIGRPAFVGAVNKNGLFLDTLQFQESVRVEASTELSAVRGAEIVLFCVKTTDNATTARALASLLAPGAVVLSMQNGVDNVEQLRAAAAIEALPAVVYVAASVPEPGRVKHVGRGDLVVGPENEKTKRITSLFARAQVPCRITENIEGELWTKLVWNCALNAVSALGRAKYGQIASSADAWKVVETKAAWSDLSMEQLLEELQEIQQFVLLYPRQGEKGTPRAAYVLSSQTLAQQALAKALKLDELQITHRR
ncbi:MAG: 2-dehydropantoate 2-reductase [Acidobacteria bacterium]|nr:MAG: 2-dehydropantoate 2-reductase [Acidobacteriota bacterium]